MFLLIPLPAEANPVPEEGRGKGNSGRPHSSSDSKIVFTLLTKVVAVYVRLSMVYIRGMGVQLLQEFLDDDVSWSGSGSGSGSGSENGSRSKNGSNSENRSRSRELSLQNSLKNLLQVIFGVLGDISSSSEGISNGRFSLLGPSELIRHFVTRLGRCRRVRGSDGGSGRETLAAGTSANLGLRFS